MTYFSPIRSLLLLGLSLILLTGCDSVGIQDRTFPNGPSLEGVLEDPTRDKIANLAAGIESSLRTDMDLYLIDVGVIGREYYRFTASDPRFTADLLGGASSVLDNNTFYITRPWAERYRAVRNCYILLEAVDLVSEGEVSPAEKSAARGFARTIIAHQLLLNLNLTYFNGIRVDVQDPDNPGAVRSYDEALADIAGILDQGLSDLQSGGTLPFSLSDGFSGSVETSTDTPVSFVEFNRALAARVAIYQGDGQGALDALEGSFLATEDPGEKGIYHVFSTNSGDITNPIFLDPSATGDLLAAHPSYVEDIPKEITENDTTFLDDRINDVERRFNEDGEAIPFSQVGLESDWGFARYPSQTSPIPIIRNAELILIRAEARTIDGATQDLDAAVDDLNVIRNAAGLDDYSGAVTAEAVLDELLRQRRYELYGEGHRWIDVRRLRGDDCSSDARCLDDDLPIDRPEDNVWLQFPVPASENVGS